MIKSTFLCLLPNNLKWDNLLLNSSNESKWRKEHAVEEAGDCHVEFHWQFLDIKNRFAARRSNAFQ